MGTIYYVSSKIYMTREVCLGKIISTSKGKTKFIFDTNCLITDSYEREISIQDFIKDIKQCDDISFQEDP